MSRNTEHAFLFTVSNAKGEGNSTYYVKPISLSVPQGITHWSGFLYSHTETVQFLLVIGRIIPISISQPPFGFCFSLLPIWSPDVTLYFGSLGFVLNYFQVWVTFPQPSHLCNFSLMSGHLACVTFHRPCLRSHSVKKSFHHHFYYSPTIKINKQINNHNLGYSIRFFTFYFLIKVYIKY